MNVLKRLVGSRKFLVALGSLVVITGVLVAGWDEQTAQETADKLINVVMVLSGLFIGGTALEDAAEKFGKR